MAAGEHSSFPGVKKHSAILNEVTARKTATTACV
jgi:hypothetical protein